MANEEVDIDQKIVDNPGYDPGFLDDEDDEEMLPSEYSLTSYGIDFDVAGLVRRFEKELIQVPFFQRDYVWTFTKACKFIESILIGLPIPGIFLYKDDQSPSLMVIDGQQRIRTLAGFVNGYFNDTPFSLRNVHRDYKGLNYKKLSPELKAKLDDTIIHATVVKPDDPKKKNLESIFLIFERLNTGGLNLSPQEIRACISHGKLQDLLETLVNAPSFKIILGQKIRRRKDQEIALRLIALFHTVKQYTGNMKKYLNEYMENNKIGKSLDFDQISEIFVRTFDLLNSNLGPSYFKPQGGPVNLAVLDSIFLGVFSSLMVGKSFLDGEIGAAAKELSQVQKYKEAISTGKTHHTDSVQNRINAAIEVFARHAK